MEETAFQRALDLLKALHHEDVEYILVGGLARGLHGLVPATEDDPHIEEIVAEDLAGEYPVVRYGPPDEIFLVDILARPGEAFVYDDLQSEVKIVREIPVRVATPRTLFLMKRNTVRPKDRMDATALYQVFGDQVDP